MQNPNPQTTAFLLPNFCRDRSIFFLIAAAQTAVILLALVDAGVRPFDWQRLSLMTLHVQWVCIASAAIICGLRQRLMKLSTRISILVIWCTFVSVGFIVSCAGQVLVYSSFKTGTVGLHTMMTGLIAALILRYFYLQQLVINRSQAELRARIQALHSRIRPHFLFNSMNSIASLIPTDPATAETAVENLSDLFRASLKETDEQISLAQEVGLAKQFLFIEQLRLGSRLNVQWDIQARPEKWRIPQLTLQPLLENAIQHGIQQCIEGGTINIRLYESDKTLKITIVNPLPEKTLTQSQSSQGNRLALQNIEHRIQSIYGDTAKISATKTEKEYICILSLPRISNRSLQKIR
ncbi:sensor histidine kinase [Gynuella sunshinyii]|uniref:Putative regulator of cell autolysis n=1 Tax=Gynuella sunshinyii YC6258 TaxID=1445510 RepID=A0A0C5VH55_9GAMM|nr:histidine kinase [Gynuella sunshinyii]AJQ93571.1 putative regulator of cell autolysis [Gynuella sunshinyii YC6258]